MSTTMVKMRMEARVAASHEGRGRAPSQPPGTGCEALSSSALLPLPFGVPPGEPHSRPAIARAGPAPVRPQSGEIPPLRRLL